MISVYTLRKVSYVLKRSLDGMRRKPGLHLLSVMTLAVTFLSFAATLQAAKNLEHLLTRWIGTAPITVYLKEGISATEVDRLVKAVSQLPDVERVTAITPKAAREQFTEDMGPYGDMAASLPESAFPASIDVHLKGAALNSEERRQRLSARIGAVAMVEEVELYDDWFEKLFAISTIARASSWGLGLMAFVVALLVIAAVVRNGISARAREIEVLGLVGATRRYIRLPYQMEGAMETALAMGMALLALNLVDGYVQSALKDVMPLIGLSEIRGLGGKTTMWLIAGSALVGLVGSRLSLNQTAETQ